MELNNVISPTVVSDNSVAGQDYINFTIDNAGNIVSYNVAFKQELGYGAVKEAISLSSVTTPRDYQRLMHLLTGFEKSANAFIPNLYVHFIKMSGERVRYMLYLKKKNWAEDQSLRFYSVLAIPEMSQYELPFVSFDSRELFMRQFDVIGVGTFEWIVGEEIVYWSDTIYKIYDLQRTEEEISYAFVKEHTHPDDKKRVAAIVKDALDAGSEFNFEMKIVTAEKNVKVVAALGHFIKNADGSIYKLVGSLRDITWQKNTEKQFNDHLAQLNDSNKELEEFAYVASHDMQEPLRKINTFSSMLAERYRELLPKEGVLYLERIIASADNMKQLINNLLDFSAVANTAQAFQKISLNEVVFEAVSGLDLIVEETGSIIKCNVLPAIEGDAQQLKQLFSNLVSNSIKFRKPGQPGEIAIEAIQVPDTDVKRFGLVKGKNYFKIQVTDNGIGFEDEYASRIFKIFHRLHGKSEYPGSGIGLAICQKIVTRHNGVIYAENIQGQGARFSIILPELQH